MVHIPQSHSYHIQSTYTNTNSIQSTIKNPNFIKPTSIKPQNPSIQTSNQQNKTYPIHYSHKKIGSGPKQRIEHHTSTKLFSQPGFLGADVSSWTISLALTEAAEFKITNTATDTTIAQHISPLNSITWIWSRSSKNKLYVYARNELKWGCLRWTNYKKWKGQKGSTRIRW